MTIFIKMNPAYSRTRIAPTPSGYLHLGNAFSFLLTRQIASATGAGILLRIDDLDRERVQDKYVRDIFETLHFLGIDYQTGPRDMKEYQEQYSQVHRMELYETALEQLRHGGHLFACTCSRSALAANGQPVAYPGTCRNKGIPFDAPGVNWRLRTGDNETVMMKTVSGETNGYTFPENMRDFVVRKKDGFPAYQLTSVVDDLHFGIDLVVRGNDLLDSTLAQLYLARTLGNNTFWQVAFHHHQLLTDAGGQKLSKSEGALSLQYLRKQHTKEEILSMLSM